MSKSMIFGQHADVTCGLPPFAAVPGTGLLSSVATPLAEARGGLATARPWSRGLGLSAMPQVKKYQHMTRIAANGGDVSGSHPAWDPV